MNVREIGEVVHLPGHCWHSGPDWVVVDIKDGAYTLTPIAHASPDKWRDSPVILTTMTPERLLDCDCDSDADTGPVSVVKA